MAFVQQQRRRRGLRRHRRRRSRLGAIGAAGASGAGLCPDAPAVSRPRQAATVKRARLRWLRRRRGHEAVSIRNSLASIMASPPGDHPPPQRPRRRPKRLAPRGAPRGARRIAARLRGRLCRLFDGRSRNAILLRRHGPAPLPGSRLHPLRRLSPRTRSPGLGRGPDPAARATRHVGAGDPHRPLPHDRPRLAGRHPAQRARLLRPQPEGPAPARRGPAADLPSAAPRRLGRRLVPRRLFDPRDPPAACATACAPSSPGSAAAP